MSLLQTNQFRIWVGVRAREESGSTKLREVSPLDRFVCALVR